MSLQKLIDSLDQMKHSPVRNYVTPGLTSSLVGGDFSGTVRLFSSDRDTREFITPHSHRFNFSCLVLSGSVENILYVPHYQISEEGPGNLFAEGILRPKGEGMGQYEVVHGTEPKWYREEVSHYHAGDVYGMTYSEIHSIRFSRGAKVLFFEEPPSGEDSVFLEPYSDGRVVQTFAVQPWMFDRGKK
jgi:hypothetical protein